MFFQDAKHAIHKAKCKEIVYADDFSAYRECDRFDTNDAIKADSTVCQRELSWGDASQGSLDAGKEGIYVISHSDPTPGILQDLGR